MHDFNFIPALHQNIHDNRISGAVLLRSSRRRFFSATRPVEWVYTSLAAPGFADHWRKAKFDDSGRVATRKVIFLLARDLGFRANPNLHRSRSLPTQSADRSTETVDGVDQSFL